MPLGKTYEPDQDPTIRRFLRFAAALGTRTTAPHARELILWVRARYRRAKPRGARPKK